MQRLLSYVTAASLAVGGLGFIGGCNNDKNKSADAGGGSYSSGARGDMSSDSARNASGSTYDATGQNMGQNPPGTYGPGPTGSAGSSSRYGPGTAAPGNQNTGTTGQGGYGNYGGVGEGSGTDATGRPTGNAGSTGSGTAGSSSSSGGSAGGSAGGGGR